MRRETERAVAPEGDHCINIEALEHAQDLACLIIVSDGPRIDT